MEMAFFCRDRNTTSPTELFLIERYGKYFNPESQDLIAEIIRIGSAWNHALDRRGISDGKSNYLEKFKGYDSLCIRIKRSKILIRFPYYRDQTNDRIILLLGFVKIEGYKSGGAIDRGVERKLDEAQIYYNEYNLDNNKYIIPEIIKNIIDIQ